MVASGIKSLLHGLGDEARAESDVKPVLRGGRPWEASWDAWCTGNFYVSDLRV